MEELESKMWNPFGTPAQTPSGEMPKETQNTIDQIGGRIVNTEPIKEAESVQSFINEQPDAVYIIDGVKGEPQSIICRGKPGGGKT